MSQDNDNNFLFSDDLTDEELEKMLAELVPDDSSSVDDSNTVVDADTAFLRDVDTVGTGDNADGLLQETTLDETIGDEDFVFELEDMLDESEDLDVQETLQPMLNPSQMATDEKTTFNEPSATNEKIAPNKANDEHIATDSLEDFEFEMPEIDVAIEDFSIDEPALPKVERQPEVDFTDATLQEAAFEKPTFKEADFEEATFNEPVSETPIIENIEETEDTTVKQPQQDTIEPVYNLDTDLENNSEDDSETNSGSSHHKNHDNNRHNIDEKNRNAPPNTSATPSIANQFTTTTEEPSTLDEDTLEQDTLKDTSLTRKETTSETMSERRSIQMPKIQAEITPEMIAKKNTNSTSTASSVSKSTSESNPKSHATTSPIAALEPMLQSKLQADSNQATQPLESNNEVATPDPVELSTESTIQDLALTEVTDVDIGELSHIEHHTRLLKTYLNEIEAPFLAANQVSTQLIREVRQLQKAQRGQYKNTHAQTHELRTKLITARKHFIELLSIVDLVEENLESEHCEQIHYTE